ncbi:DeoR/GlpR family DNA-binding transcription regulator [Jeotgalibaca caeni]|uniref:DeoR/GlpR family DNA-binding transcription regulator n=1 Tax=Jeotgalibaca caeni TaxID=3028623 RepID=UPI00237D45FD|nr:DeoR/GlpR family DNA-binding transcription regulator [Jeotgalibaca caeni]MDE1549787.1 DeoR/GlpR family DNA-binding transcription regulator [Jeotgalibaca caeni]
MLAFERREAITKKIMQEKKILVSDLSIRFEVSEETIRRDLEKLEKEGILTRTHGGATLLSQTNQDIPYITRNTLNRDRKAIIAQKVLEIVPDHATLMVDASSTVFEAIDAMKNVKENLTVITNSIDVLYSFLNSDLQLISTGGTLRKPSQSMVGVSAELTLNRYNVDFGMFSCRSLSLQSGIMDSNEPESEIKKAMSNRSSKVIMLVDSTKFDTESFINVFSLDEIDYLITDEEPPQVWIDTCLEKNIELIY